MTVPSPARLLPGLLLPGVLGGCAANLATLQGPETLEQGQLSASGEVGFGLPLGTTGRAVKAGVDLADGAYDYGQSGEPVALETLAGAVGAGMGLALSPPGTVYGASLRVGVLDNLDLGLRLSSSDIKLDTKIRVVDGGERGVSHAIGLAFHKHRFEGLVFDVFDPIQKVSTIIPGLELQEPKRWDVSARWLTGARPGENLKVYGGLEARLGRYEVPWFLTGEDYGWPEIVQLEEQKGWNPILNGTGGIAVGKDPVWVRGELNLAYSLARTEVLNLPVNFGGVSVFPAASLEFAPQKRQR